MDRNEDSRNGGYLGRVIGAILFVTAAIGVFGLLISNSWIFVWISLFIQDFGSIACVAGLVVAVWMFVRKQWRETALCFGGVAVLVVVIYLVAKVSHSELFGNLG